MLKILGITHTHGWSAPSFVSLAKLSFFPRIAIYTSTNIYKQCSMFYYMCIWLWRRLQNRARQKIFDTVLLQISSPAFIYLTMMLWSNFEPLKKLSSDVRNLFLFQFWRHRGSLVLLYYRKVQESIQFLQ